MNLPHLAQRLFNTPLALHPSKAEVIMASVMDRFGITKIESSLAMDDDWYSFDDSRGRESRNDPGYENVLGIAVIPICGTLVQKLGSLRPYSGMTGYDGIRQAFLTAMEDQDVSGICLDIDSPGGEVAGCFDLVDVIYNSRGEKAYSCHSDRKRLFRRLRYRKRCRPYFCSANRWSGIDWCYHHASRLDAAN